MEGGHAGPPLREVPKQSLGEKWRSQVQLGNEGRKKIFGKRYIHPSPKPSSTRGEGNYKERTFGNRYKWWHRRLACAGAG